jgi:hypothetical protein
MPRVTPFTTCRWQCPERLFSTVAANGACAAATSNAAGENAKAASPLGALEHCPHRMSAQLQMPGPVHVTVQLQCPVPLQAEDELQPVKQRACASRDRP